MAALVLLTVVLSRGACDVVFAGHTTPPSRYLELVASYIEGREREVVQRFLALERAKLEGVFARLEHVRAMVARHTPKTLGPDDDCLRAASLLHLEAGRKAIEDARWATSTFHFDSSWRVTGLIASEETRTRFQRDWLLAAGLAHHELIFWTDPPDECFTRADRYFASTLRRFPEDGEILLAQGALLEWAGSLKAGDSAHLEEAASLYRRLLRIGPRNPEALVRYGFTLRSLREDREAEDALGRALSVSSDPHLIYRSRMGLGALAERGGRLVTHWQVAYVALSHALPASGSHGRARDVLGVGLALDPKAEADAGWWTDEMGLVLRLAPLLERMRDEVKP